MTKQLWELLDFDCADDLAQKIDYEGGVNEFFFSYYGNWKMTDLLKGTKYYRILVNAEETLKELQQILEEEKSVI